MRDQPESEQALTLLVAAHQRNGDVSLAQDTLRRIIRINPRNMKARQNLVRILVAKKDTDAAVALLQEGLRLAPNDIATLRMLVALRIQRKEWEPAEKLAKTMIPIGDDETLGRYSLGKVYQAQGKFTEASAEY